MAGPSFTQLPTEILEAIFLGLDPRSLISVSQTSKLIRRLTTDAPVIWRHFCQTQFTTWDARHNIAAKFAGPLSDVDWRTLYIAKVQIDRQTRSLLQHVISTQHQRVRCINEIADFGHDAKETLLRESSCPDDAEDVLARRYYATAALERIQREAAIRIWKELRDGDDVPLERALGAYDVFARVGEDVGIDMVDEAIDRLAAGLIAEYPGFPNLSTRNQASTVATFLRDQGFQGVSDGSYLALRNSFIGLVLSSANHESLPLVSVAIYCALARRVGLNARPCGMMFHVYTIVYAPPNYTLDGKYKPSSSSELDYMYIDPFRGSTEVGEGDLQRVLRDMGVPRDQYHGYLSDADTHSMVIRTAKNIMNSVQATRQAEAGLRGIEATWLNAYPDMDNAFYATIWSMMVLTPSDGDPKRAMSRTSHSQRQYLPYLLEHFQTHCPWDVALLGQYVIPMFRNQPEGPRLLQFVESMHHTDAMRKPVLSRNEVHGSVRFKVGQLFQHRRYSYEGVITGWDVNCGAGEEWIHTMGVDSLPNGRSQAFYHVLVCDKSVRYVAEENIEPVCPEREPSEALIRLAGRHFKRWDADNHVFVSNVRDEYPDD